MSAQLRVGHANGSRRQERFGLIHINRDERRVEGDATRIGLQGLVVRCFSGRSLFRLQRRAIARGSAAESHSNLPQGWGFSGVNRRAPQWRDSQQANLRLRD
jgi:hypothetical protein